MVNSAETEAIEVYGGDGVPPKVKRKRGVKTKVVENKTFKLIDFPPAEKVVSMKNEALLAKRIMMIEEHAQENHHTSIERDKSIEKRFDEILSPVQEKLERTSEHLRIVIMILSAAFIISVIVAIVVAAGHR